MRVEARKRGPFGDLTAETRVRSVIDTLSASSTVAPPQAGPLLHVSPAPAIVETSRIYHDGKFHETKIYERTKLRAGNRIAGPAIVTQMDATTLILPAHSGEVDAVGTILIRPL